MSPPPNQTAKSEQTGLSTLWFAATTLLGAFLVFQVQPVISKCVLPWFGGTPAVWTTCMLFFQLLLFAGYLYAHVLKSYLKPSIQGAIHLSLLSAAALSLPIEPSDAWKPSGTESPTLYLLWMLLCHVGLPYFVLSSTGPLIQAWLSYQDSSEKIYRLYSLSNAGSLLALLSYPFAVEPFLSVSSQSVVWSLMFCGFVLIQSVIAIRLFRVVDRDEPQPSASAHESTTTSIPWQHRVAWVTLPAFASTLLLVVTNHVCQDVAVIPFLWVLPLSLYLLSFIICFDSPQWYKPKWIALVSIVAIAAIQTKNVLPFSLQLLTEASCYMVLLLGVCLLCHGEVARVKPAARWLTQYYALLSAGGAIGGLIVAVACPLLFNHFIELPLTLSIASALTVVIFFACRGWRLADYDWNAAKQVKFAVMLVMALPIVHLSMDGHASAIASNRNFFGVLRVQQDEEGTHLVHGRTIHGMQRPGEASSQPTSYYYYDSGVGRVISALQERSPSIKTGVIGLGCGVLASYGRTEDEFDMVEINPAIQQIASEHFTFLSDCPSTIRHHLGDGRLVMERMHDSRFDLIVLDAFSSDAIPAHLLTSEAFELYRMRMSPGGVLAVHVSNNHLDLSPLVHRLAKNASLESRVVYGIGDASISVHQSCWVILADADNAVWDHPAMATARPASPEQLRDAPLWTDQHHNLLSVLNLW
ncbi:fused MFS/spermidine synthase [Novipirellula caenicola]|uniref:Polyamine aminopropyltransferase n=1 Tax=Novipirellula caenicola TaxID=1536901 RepID=A0ABP9VN50_9BACT